MTDKKVMLADIAAILLFACALVALIGWLSAGVHKPAVVNATPAPTGGTTGADDAAAALAPNLLSFSTDDARVRELIVVVVGNDNSSRLMTFSKDQVSVPVLYRMAATLLEQGAETLSPTQDKPREEHQL